MIYVDADTFTQAFYTYHVGHYYPSYVRSFIDFNNDNGSEKTIKFQAENDKIYIMSETYYQPFQCSHYPILLFRVFLDDITIPYKKVYSFEQFHKPLLLEGVKSRNVTVTVQYDW